MDKSKEELVREVKEKFNLPLKVETITSKDSVVKQEYDSDGEIKIVEREYVTYYTDKYSMPDGCAVSDELYDYFKKECVGADKITRNKESINISYDCR